MQDNQQPGQLIVPHSTDVPNVPGDGAPEPERPTEQPAQEPVPTPGPAPEPEAPAVVEQPIPAPDQPENGWFHHEDDPTVAVQAYEMPDDLTWTASEFIAHDKSSGWYMTLVLIAAVITLLTYLITKDKFSTGVVLLVVIMFGVVAGRKPRTQQYSLGRAGIQVGPKVYNFKDFKTFSVAHEGASASVIFMPLKRFMPALTLYLAPDMEDRVVDYLAAVLPFEQHKDDMVDSLLRRIHF